ncbi:MAG TPA: hypothetical protein VHB98_12250 [Chloroflexota bacterium]|nr:hypothetical protein [Chloroflexota bacterium]
MQLSAPSHLRDRILSLHGATLSTLYPLGSVCQGAIADHLGLRPTTVGAACLLAAVLALSASRGWQAGLLQGAIAPPESALTVSA